MSDAQFVQSIKDSGADIDFTRTPTAGDFKTYNGLAIQKSRRSFFCKSVGDGGDIMRLSNDVISQGAATNYRLFLEQPDVAGVRVGAAVSEFQNPITRSILSLVVHPWLTQGTASTGASTR